MAVDKREVARVLAARYGLDLRNARKMIDDVVSLYVVPTIERESWVAKKFSSKRINKNEYKVTVRTEQ